MNLSVVIPLFNEAASIPQLVDEVLAVSPETHGITEVVLVNNGSSDHTGDLINAASRRSPLFNVLHLAANRNYGGGILAGIELAKNDYVAIIPGDLQVTLRDLVAVWVDCCSRASAHPNEKFLAKGFRRVRSDPWHTQLVSWVYTRLACILLQLNIRDINGLPKIFHKSLICSLPAEKMLTFVLDAQLLLFASLLDWPINEVEVTFDARRHGISSWSGKRLIVYRDSFGKLLRLRRQRLLFKAERKRGAEKTKW